ncbi:MAG: peptidase M24, partial [Bacteroidota bacterium]
MERIIHIHSMRIIFFLLTLLIIVPSSAQEAAHRWRKLNQIRRDKFDLVLPSVMRENGIDMWIIMCREGNFDPI